MAKESFRFIHASDFHLERPMQDVLDLPDHLRRSLVEAPWKAAEAVFEHAVVRAEAIADDIGKVGLRGFEPTVVVKNLDVTIHARLSRSIGRLVGCPEKCIIRY